MSNINTNVALDLIQENLQSKDSWSEYEVHFAFGDSQCAGQNADTAFDLDKDARDPRILQVSLGRPRGTGATGKTVPSVGQLMPADEPLQHDTAGSGDVGPILPYLRRRLQLFPGIKQIIVVNAAVGGSSLSALSNGTVAWEPDSASYNSLVSMVNDVLGEYPEARLVSCFMSLGTVDAPTVFASEPGDNPLYDEEACLDLFRTLISRLRVDIQDATELSFALVGLPTWFLQAGPAYGIMDRIHKAVIAGDDRIVGVDTRDLKRARDEDGVLLDALHFDGAGYRVIGQRAAQALAPVTFVRIKPGCHRFRFDPERAEWRDIWGGATVISNGFTLPFAKDAERGTVLDCPGSAVATTARIDASSEYSISMKVKMSSRNGGGNQQNVLGFKAGSESLGMSFNLASGLGSLLHEGLTASGEESIESIDGQIGLDEWVTVGVTWKAGEAAVLYKDGMQLGTQTSADATPALTERRVLIGGFNNATPTDNAFDGLIDDVVIVNRKLNDAGMQRLHWG